MDADERDEETYDSELSRVKAIRLLTARNESSTIYTGSELVQMLNPDYETIKSATTGKSLSNSIKPTPSYTSQKLIPLSIRPAGRGILPPE
ncbi:hypothetical protein COLO4_02488 [Corchorus olitorius]|uniref:Uncharacterized protein n=1 Tax=Corchorus olitorius TaxID=93759 RepID=A0A1R3L0V6_9ROSI|nr:hypothetical protein COLO4_02488 [Corchorus olitorius]